MTFLFYQAACRRNCQVMPKRQDDIPQPFRLDFFLYCEKVCVSILSHTKYGCRHKVIKRVTRLATNAGDDYNVVFSLKTVNSVDLTKVDPVQAVLKKSGNI